MEEISHSSIVDSLIYVVVYIRLNIIMQWELWIDWWQIYKDRIRWLDGCLKIIYYMKITSDISFF